MEGKTVEEVTREAEDVKSAAAARAAALADERAAAAEARAAEAAARPRMVISVPTSIDAMTTQAARAVERAHADGIVLQTVRLALVKADETLEEDAQWPGVCSIHSRTPA